MPAKEPCEIIIQHGSASKIHLTPLHKTTMERCDLGATDPRIREVLGYISGGRVFKENESVCISLILVAEDGIDYTDSIVEVPITTKDVKTGEKGEIWLGNSGQHQFTFVADGTIFQAGVQKLWAYWDVPKGMNAVLGHKTAFTSRLYIIPYDDT